MQEFARLNESGTQAVQLPPGNIAWDDDHFCPASALSEEEKTQFGVVPLEVVQPPVVDGIFKVVIRDGCVNENGVWKYKWAIQDLPEDQVLQNIRAFSASLTSQLTNEYETRMGIIGTSYPPSERESWPVQIQEARLFLAYHQEVTADPAYTGTAPSTPWLDNACEARGIDKVELSTRIVSKDMMYRTISGKLSGVRQKHEDVIWAAGDNIKALRAIDIKKDWPNFG